MTIKTRSGLKTDLPDNSTGDISPADVRQLADSLAVLAEVVIRVENTTTTTPPAGPADREAYVVGSGATGAWAGQDNNIAIWDGSLSPNEWFFIQPVNGQLIWDRSVEEIKKWGGSVSPSEWAGGATAPSGARAQLTAAESINDDSDTAIPWDTVSTGNAFDDESFWSPANPTRLTAPRDGLYLAVGGIDTAAFAATFIQAWIALNGAGIPGQGGSSNPGSGTSGSHFLNPHTILRLSAGDYVELWIYQSSGSSRNVDATDATFLSLVRL